MWILDGVAAEKEGDWLNRDEKEENGYFQKKESDVLQHWKLVKNSSAWARNDEHEKNETQKKIAND